MFGNKKTEKKKNTLKISLMFITAMMTLATIPSFSMLLFGTMTVLLLPIEPIESLWDRLLQEKKKTFRPIILTTVFVVACITSPLDEQNPDTINSDTTVSSSIEDTATDVTEDRNSEIIALASENSMESISTAEIPQYISNTNISMDEIPEYSGNAYVSINDNVPFFTDDEMITEAFEYYSELDSLGRCGVAYANVCVDIMPTEESEK